MAKIKITCPTCGEALQCDEKFQGQKIKCPHCKHPVIVSPVAADGSVPVKRRGTSKKRKFLISAGALVLLGVLVATAFLFIWPVRVHWPDRRPVGALFLASSAHTSATNPRGWFNDPTLDVIGPGGHERFRKALLAYADRSLAILKRTDAQGVIVWDLEGEQYPHKTTYIGDPRWLNRLAPEMEAVADEFFTKFRDAGLKVGLTIRPQELEFDKFDWPHQSQVVDTGELLREKIDFASKRWGATMFYVDSSGGIRRPDEVWQLRSLAKQRPDILLIPEHTYLPYAAFSAPYASLRTGGAPLSAKWARKLYPGSFQVVDIADASDDRVAIDVAWSQGDILLFRAWFDNPESTLLENFAHEHK